MTTAINTPAVQAVLAERLRVVLANSVTGIYGLSGSGKSTIADTATEYAFDNFGSQTLYYTADLGGYGTRRLALIRKRIAFAWDPRNHVNPMETMEAISHGAFPAYLLPGGPATADERDRGWAPPDAELVYPIRDRWTRQCPSGHVEGHYYKPELLAGALQLRPLCATCSQPLGVVYARVKHAAFTNIGHRVADSVTAMNEWGFSDLQRLAATGQLPKVGDRGSTLLGGADALIQGNMRWSGGSQQQVGFMQNRSHDWIANLKVVEGHVIPPTATFLVEMSKGDDDSGGMRVLGPKIQGNARTSSVPGWLGNCLHAVREPLQPGNPASPMVYRLWLKMHVDPMDLRSVPYLAKTRGTPVGMPDYLEDPQDPALAWSVVNLGVLYDKLVAQVADEEARLDAKYGDRLAALQADPPAEETVTTVVAGAGANSPSAGLAPSVTTGGASLPGQPAPAAAKPARRIAGAPVVQTVAVPVTAAPAPRVPAAAPVPETPAPAAAVAGSPAGSAPAATAVPASAATAGSTTPPAGGAAGVLRTPAPSRRPPVALPPPVATAAAAASVTAAIVQGPVPTPAPSQQPAGPAPPSPPAPSAASPSARPGTAPRRAPRPPVG